jgi:hypothetical protein
MVEICLYDSAVKSDQIWGQQISILWFPFILAIELFQYLFNNNSTFFLNCLGNFQVPQFRSNNSHCKYILSMHVHYE